MVDYYKVLEVQRTASIADIKNAYKKLALKWHPDKNPDNLEEANKRFKKISEAYEILSDEEKKHVYDQYDKDDLQMPGGKRRDEDDFDSHFGGTFVFRNSEEVYREFLAGISFDYEVRAFGAENFTSCDNSSSFDGMSGARTIVSTRFIDGKKITTRKVYENGKWKEHNVL